MTIINMTENFFPTLWFNIILHDKVNILKTLQIAIIIPTHLIDRKSIVSLNRWYRELLIIIFIWQIIERGNSVFFLQGFLLFHLFRNIKNLPIELLMMYLTLKWVLSFNEPTHQDEKSIIPFDARSDYVLILFDKLLIKVAFLLVLFLKLFLSREVIFLYYL